MTKMMAMRGYWIRPAMLVAVPVVSTIPSGAAAETVATLDASAGVTAASNPYLLAGPDTEAVGVNVTLQPTITWTEDDTIVTLNGAVILESFFGDYDLDETVQLGASFVHRATERTTISADAGFITSESAASRFFGGADLRNLEPGEFPDRPIIDPTLGNVAGRSTRFDANTVVEHLVSESGSLSFSAGVGMTSVESGVGEDYRDSRLGITYSRNLNERTLLSASISAGYADYLNRQAGDGLFTTSLVGVDHQITQSMYGSFQLGVSYAAVNTLLTGREHVVGWAASLNLCDVLARGTLCATGYRGIEPTSRGGITTVSTIGVSYSRQLGEDDNLSLTANYSRSGMSESSPIILGRRDSEIVLVSGSYSRRIGERLSAFVTPSFTATNDEFSGQYENYEVLAGITYHFGNKR